MSTQYSIPFAEALLTPGTEELGLDDKVELLATLRSQSRQMSQSLDRFLLENLEQRTNGLLQAQNNIDKLKAVLESLTAEPWQPATVMRPAQTSRGQRVVVMVGNTRRVVEIGEGIRGDDLCAGDEVYLSNDLNTILEKSQEGPCQFGETASYVCSLSDGRIIVNSRDEEFVVQAAKTLRVSELQRGDRVRWDRTTQIAYERLPQSEGRQFLLNEIPDVSPDQVGGQKQNLRNLIATLTTTLVDPDKATAYGVGGRLPTVLLIGPPGTGKTLMARVAASEISRTTGTRCRFGVVKPGEFETPWVGETQQRIRSCFQALREAAQEGLAVLFLDEIESIGRHRGHAVGFHSDKFLAALLAELDGFEGHRGVCVISATNRKDLLDPALLERFEIEVTVNRPDMRAAQEIFEIHLPESLPFACDGSHPSDTRLAMIESAVSLFYSPNAENELATIKFRDGKTRTVVARELASGRVFEQICRTARRSAFLRDIRGGAQGLCMDDMREALADALERLQTTLTPQNAAAYLPDLPQDIDVVSVEPVQMRRHLLRSHRYLQVAA